MDLRVELPPLLPRVRQDAAPWTPASAWQPVRYRDSSWKRTSELCNSLDSVSSLNCVFSNIPLPSLPAPDAMILQYSVSYGDCCTTYLIDCTLLHT
jgi:hypothetical protein